MKTIQFEHLAPLEFHLLNHEENKWWHTQPEQLEVGIDYMEPITRLNCQVIDVAIHTFFDPDWDRLYLFHPNLLDWPHLGDLSEKDFIEKKNRYSCYGYFTDLFTPEQYKEFFNSFGEYTQKCLKENPKSGYPFVAIYDAKEGRYLFSEEEPKLKLFW